MGFIPHKNDGSTRPQSLEYLPCGAITPKKGLALKWDASNGVLVLNGSGTTKPDYICMREEAAAVTSGTIIPVYKVNPDEVFETVWGVAGTSLKEGARVQCHTDGLSIAATNNASNPALVVGKEGTGAVGDTVYVRFA